MISGVAGVGAVEAAEPASTAYAKRDVLVAEAAERYAIPTSWIWAVMRVESAYDPRAVSKAGALGLMQVMPKTYADLRARHGLGADPFHPRDNILAGAAYLRELYDRFGAPGFLAAYNAGPHRYTQHLVHGRPLPLETRNYLAVLTPVVMTTAAEPNVPVIPPSVFVRLRSGQGDVETEAPGLFVARTSQAVSP